MQGKGAAKDNCSKWEQRWDTREQSIRRGGGWIHRTVKQRRCEAGRCEVEFNISRISFSYLASFTLTSAIRLSGHMKVVINSMSQPSLCVWNRKRAVCRYKKKQHTENSMWLFVGVNRLKWLIRRKQYHINTGGKEGRLPVNILISITFLSWRHRKLRLWLHLCVRLFMEL